APDLLVQRAARRMSPLHRARVAAGDRPRPRGSRSLALDRRRRARPLVARRLVGLLRGGDPGRRRAVRDRHLGAVGGAARECTGARLKPEVLAVTVGGRSINEFTQMSVTRALAFLDELDLTATEELIGHRIVKEIRERLTFLDDVGVGYLTLDRAAATLSGGEAQRLRLATQIGSQLVGVLYILDEPSIGLHQRDNARLIATLERL